MSERATRPMRSRDARDTGDPDRTRRRFIWFAGAAAVAGLAGRPGGGGVEPSGTIATMTQSSGSTGGVPETYATVTSLDGTQHNPDSLLSQEVVSCQDEPSEGRQCLICRYYIEDKNGDGMGACAVVTGKVDLKGYCVSCVEYEEQLGWSRRQELSPVGPTTF